MENQVIGQYIPGAGGRPGDVAWQEPETWLDDQFARGELSICRSCGRIYQSYGNTACSCRNGGCQTSETQPQVHTAENRIISNQRPGIYRA